MLGVFPPVSIFIARQLAPLVVGRSIIRADYKRYYIGKYSWHGDESPSLVEEMTGQKIIFADASRILTEGGILVHFTYFDGDLRYFAPGEAIIPRRTTKSTTHAYMMYIHLDDGACVTINLYSWSTLLEITRVDPSKALGKQSAIDITDPEDFTLERFTEWLSDKPSVNIVENCSTAKGAFALCNPVMSYILLASGIHPRTKTRLLTEAEIASIHRNASALMEDYRSSRRVCPHRDLFGKDVEGVNDVMWMTSKTLGKPCPVCNTPIQATPCAGTKIYFCPQCQVKK